MDKPRQTITQGADYEGVYMKRRVKIYPVTDEDIQNLSSKNDGARSSMSTAFTLFGVAGTLVLEPAFMGNQYFGGQPWSGELKLIEFLIVPILVFLAYRYYKRGSGQLAELRSWKDRLESQCTPIDTTLEP